MALAHSLHQGPFPEHQLASLIRDVAAQVLLQVGLLVIVDTHQCVPRLSCQESHQGSLPAGCGTLHNIRATHSIGLHLSRHQMGYEGGPQLGYMLDSSVLVKLLMRCTAHGRSGKSSSREACCSNHGRCAQAWKLRCTFRAARVACQDDQNATLQVRQSSSEYFGVIRKYSALEDKHNIIIIAAHVSSSHTMAMHVQTFNKVWSFHP